MVDRDEPAEPEEGVLEPDELEVERREEVQELGENRYIVSTDDDEGDDDGRTRRDQEPAPSGRTPPTGPEDRPRPGADPASTELSEPTVPSGSRTPLVAVGERYAVDIAAKVDGSVDDRRLGSDSIVETFEETLVWYARQVDDSTPPEEVIRILLAESDLDVSLLD